MIFKSLMLCFATALLAGAAKDADNGGLCFALTCISIASLGAALIGYLDSGGREIEKAHESRPCPCCGFHRRY